MNSISERLAHSLEKRKQANSFRMLQPAEQGRVDFSSNDYLGLARNQELATLIKNAYAGLPVSLGSGGSRLLSGNSPLAEALEQQMARFFKADASLLFNSGYAANLALLSALPQKGDTILYDELAHACIKDGARLSLARRYTFRHNDPESLRQRMQKATGSIFVVVESVYSMDGDAAPLRELAGLCREFGAALIVDEAHSTGIYGGGSGLVNELALQEDIFARVHTFGKAMGQHGACVTGTSLLKDYLINFARPFIYTTALPQHSLVSLQEAFGYLEGNPGLPVLLMERVSLFKELRQQHLIPLLPAAFQVESNSPIQALVFPGNEAVKKLAAAVQAKGFGVKPILSPTVPLGKERLRVCLHTYNSEEEIKGLVEILVKNLK